jgi:hypothetical protein
MPPPTIQQNDFFFSFYVDIYSERTLFVFIFPRYVSVYSFTLPLSSPFLPFAYQIFHLFLFLFFTLLTAYRPPTVSITSTDIPPRIHSNILRDSPEKFQFVFDLKDRGPGLDPNHFSLYIFINAQ